MNVIEALASLDPEEDDHWTADGLPRMDAIHELVEDTTITRAEVTNADPHLIREVAAARLQGIDDEPEEEEFEEGDPVRAVVDDEVEDYDEDVDVFALPIGQVTSDPELTNRAIEAVENRVNETLAAKAAIERELEQLYAKAGILQRAEVLHRRSKPKHEQRTAVQEYLKGQAGIRAERAERAQAFIDAGTTQKDVLDRMTTKSKIDQAMTQRKPRPDAVRRPPRLMKSGS